MTTPLKFGALTCVILTGVKIFTIHFSTLFISYVHIYQGEMKSPSGKYNTTMPIVKLGVAMYGFQSSLCCLSCFCLIVGIVKNRIKFVAFWLFLVALKMLSSISILTAATIFTTKNPVPFFWPYAEFPFVLFWGILWIVVFFYYLEISYDNFTVTVTATSATDS